MSDEELRSAIEALIAEDQAGGWQESLPAELAARIVALLPAVIDAEQQARERAAKELRAAADACPSPGHISLTGRRWLKDRADALDNDLL